MVAVGRFDRRRLYDKNGFGLVFIERGFAFSAKIVDGPELHEVTMIAPYNFPRINRRQCGSH
jgi:hypothetical protein